MDILSTLKFHQIEIDPDFSGKLIRSGHNNRFWFVGRILKIGEKSLKIAHFGDFHKSDDILSWQENGDLTPDEIDLFKKAANEELELHQKEKERNWESVAYQVNSLVRHLPPCDVHDYLTKKGLPKGFGALLGERGELTLPLQDIHGKIWTAQSIFPSGQKRFFPGGKKRGNFYPLLPSESLDPSTIYVCEGFATGASIFLSLDEKHPVYCAMDAGGLEPVCQALRAKYKDATIIVCADHDESGVGLEKANLAADASQGIIVMPREAGKDFNDLLLSSGASAVKASLAKDRIGDALGGLAEGGGTAGGEFSLPIDRIPGAGPTPAKPTKGQIEKRLADMALQEMGESLIRQGDTLFQYKDNKWSEVSKYEIDQIKNRLNFFGGNRLGSKEVNDVYRTFFRYLDKVPEGVNLFEPNPFAANFKNGTLHLRRSKTHAYTLEFLPHKKEDYMINILPYDYDPTKREVNSEFVAMLDRVFEGDQDKQEKITAVQEMFGACLVPAFPRLFMLHGKPGTGKSTVLKIAARLVSRENMSFVPPTDFKGFLMQPMAGKLVNMDTDVPVDRPMSDDVIKKVIERAPMNIQRKGLENVWAHIPAVHLFGGNNIPETKDTSGAHKRRWTFIQFSKVIDAGLPSFKGEYWDFCFEESPQGVLNFALAGLERLCASGGKFTTTESGRATMEEWSERNDFFEMFLKDIESGEVLDFEDGKMTSQSRLILDKDGKIERPKLWNIFVGWYKSSVSPFGWPNRNGTFKKFRDAGFGEYRTSKDRYFVGLRVESKNDAGF